MYQDNKRSMNWVKYCLRILILLFVIILGIKLFTLVSEKQENKKVRSNIQENLKVMDTFAKEHFQEELPKEVGATIKFTLGEMLKNGWLKELNDSENNSCSTDDSYIKITKLDSEYQLQSFLKCGDESDYLNSFIPNESDIVIKPKTTTTTTQKVTNKMTKKVKTTKKKTYTISFNTNGGALIKDQTIAHNEIIKNEIPVRNGYTFVGWYYQGKKFDMSTKVKQNYVLVAKWSKK